MLVTICIKKTLAYYYLKNVLMVKKTVAAKNT